jgi:hypothetical protein
MSLFGSFSMAVFSLLFAWLTEKPYFDFYLGESNVAFQLLLMTIAVFVLSFILSSTRKCS